MLPQGMHFEVTPLHLVAMDNHRKEFAVSDLIGARQIGFAGGHSDFGGSYGGFLEYITLNYVIDDQRKFGLNLFNRDTALGDQKNVYESLYQFRKTGLLDAYLEPVPNSHIFKTPSFASPVV